MNAEKYKALLSKRTNKVEKRAMLMSVQGVIFGFTFMMSTFETSNRTMIIIVVASFAGTFGLATHLVHGEAGLACYVAFLVVAGGFVYHAVRSLESVEVFKKKFEAVYTECTKGIEPRSGQLGPKPFGEPGLMQNGDHMAGYYIEEAERLLEPFRSEVLDVLANAADPTRKVVVVLSNTKGCEVSALVSTCDPPQHKTQLKTQNPTPAPFFSCLNYPQHHLALPPARNGEGAN